MKDLLIDDIEKFQIIAQALSSKSRIKILKFLLNNNSNINEISKKLNMPMPTVTVNIKKLEEAKIISCTQEPGKHGLQKKCSINYNSISLKLLNSTDNPSSDQKTQTDISEDLFNISVGDYSNYQIVPECGMASEYKIIGEDDDEKSFNSSDKNNAQIIWFNDGYVEYSINTGLKNVNYESLTISFEACSEHLYFNRNWPSDITLWLNEKEIGTYTSSGEFSGSLGKLTPDWWTKEKTQFGELVTFKIDKNSCFINGHKTSNENINTIELESILKIRIGIKNDSENSRGIIIFGEKFGNYKQNINVKVSYIKK